MAENTKIEWAHHTWNPWEGCQKAGPGCLHCYAETRNARFGGGVAINWGPGAPRRRTSASNWQLPIKWDREAKAKGIRYRVFCASLADVFDNEVDPQWRADLFALIRRTPHLDWLLLTKRIGNAAEMIRTAIEDFDIGYVPAFTAWPWPNVWIGATVVNQEEADRDIPKLWRVPAAKRFLSIEPMLGPINLTAAPETCPNKPEDCCGGPCTVDYLNGSMDCPACEGAEPIDGSIDWVIVGGESGPNARPMHPDWARSLRDQCTAAGVPFLFKQWGEWREPEHGENFDTSMGRAAKPPAFILSETGTVHCFESEHIVNGTPVIKVGKKAAGRLLDGRTWDEVPA